MERPKGIAIIADKSVTIIDPTIIDPIPKNAGFAVGAHFFPLINFISPYCLTKSMPDLKIKKVIRIIKKMDIMAEIKNKISPNFSLKDFILS